MKTTTNELTSRREFLKTSAVIGSALAAPAILPGKLWAADNSDTLRIGLVGCGGRGTGAAGQALAADNNVSLVAMGDAFSDQLERSLKVLKEQAEVANKVKVVPEKCFVGLDAYQKVIDSGVDVVILATPPGFRPTHLKAAIEAGKHVFSEKPVATDGPGIRTALAAAETAKQKKLALVAGFCWRYSPPERALFQRVLDGDIGDVRVIYGTYYTGPVKPMPSPGERPPGITDLQWEVRNWQNFYWLSGDSFVEQAVHAVDWMCWAMKDVPPLEAVAIGGRQIPAQGGNIFDHFEVNFEFAEGVRGFIGSRQQAGCFSDNTATMFGTKGTAHEMGFRGAPFIKGARDWRYDGSKKDMYQVEHDEMFASIRSGNPINNGVRLAHSSLAAIMGRMAAYTGQKITWKQALNSQEELVPANLTWDMALNTAPTAMPGVTKFA